MNKVIDLNKPISTMELPNYNIVKMDFIKEKFIQLKESDRIKIDLQYPKLGFENAVNKAYIRQTAHEMLLEALEYLPEEYCFKILDVWRPFKLQKELFNKYSKKIIEDFNLNDLSEEDSKEFISKFVADPIYDRDYSPMHTTGGAIDLTIVKQDGTELDFGVYFDEFTDRTETDFYEKNDISDEIKKNRRLLYNVMTAVGFTNLSSEIWHYDYGDKNWAYYTKNPGLYKGVFEEEEIIL